jgi:predicted nucleotidyltransferase
VLATAKMSAMRHKERLVARIESLPAVRLAVLFGSAARGSTGPRSDVDLGLRIEPDTAATRGAVEAALGRASGEEVDVIYLDEAPPQLRFEIARDGVLLVERQPHAWADFRARAMLDWWDWAPTARRMHAEAVRRLREKLGHGAA